MKGIESQKEITDCLAPAEGEPTLTAMLCGVVQCE